MGRPVDLRRRQQLLDGAVDYVTDHGLAGMSLRPLAAALGTDASGLLHHFGSKENLLVEILNNIRDRLRAVADTAAGAEPQMILNAVWLWAADVQHDPLYRLFFEAYGLALSQPDRYGAFLDHVVQDWIDQLSPTVGPEKATLALAAVRGLLLDLLTTGDRDRIHGALRLLATLE